MNEFCINLTFPFQPFESSFNLNKLKIKPHSKINLESFNIEFLNLLDVVGLKIQSAESFFRKPDSFSQIHRDVQQTNDATKINWVFGGKGSVMNWYNIIHDNEHSSTSNTGVPYLYYNLEDLELVYSKQVGFPSLLQVAMPHNVTMGKESRLCASVILQYKDTELFPTFKESSLLFKEFIMVSPPRIELGSEV